jgi:hypothetical protein
MKKHERSVLKRQEAVIISEQFKAQEVTKFEEEWDNIQLVRRSKDLEGKMYLVLAYQKQIAKEQTHILSPLILSVEEQLVMN